MIKLLFVLSALLAVSSSAVVAFWDINDGTRYSRAMQDLGLLAEIDVPENEAIDPWSRPYLQATAISGSRSVTWYFSQGPDGQSKTLGNDPDDIAQWTGRVEWLDEFYPVTKTLWVSIVSGIAAIGLGASLATRWHFRKRIRLANCC